jgi:hypothetical protein
MLRLSYWGRVLPREGGDFALWTGWGCGIYVIGITLSSRSHCHTYARTTSNKKMLCVDNSELRAFVVRSDESIVGFETVEFLRRWR